ncbi:unnamed protein product [Lactuca saligna]|uniref:F-box domain-containing protein n=1 Tax=Lactuca saligna TaxID=75948 RepID=A0AA36EP31_LACSI|nr:unnamed protein product [Lactuca saligna]
MLFLNSRFSNCVTHWSRKNMKDLPHDCVVHILSRGSPRDACRFAVVSSVVRDAAESDVLWDEFLPSDYQEIISRCVCPVKYKSKRDLFFKLSSPLLIDGGMKTFSIDKATGKRCYMLSARDLNIAWSDNPLFWCWKPILQSRFAEAVELRMTSWLEIEGKINTKLLSPNTQYRAYIIVNMASHRAYGLDILPSEVSLEVGKFHSQGTIILSPKQGSSSKFGENICRAYHERNDGWLEIELGEFYNYGIHEKDVIMRLKEIEGVHLKGGLLVEGIEIRPI